MFSLLNKNKLKLDKRTQYKLDLFIYRHIHKKIGEVLEVVFGGYPVDKYIFYPPESTLEDYFSEIRGIILELDNKEEFNKLPVTIFRQFKLYSNYKDMSEWWEMIKKDFYEDDSMLEKMTQYDYYLPDDLQMLFNNIDKLLTIHLEKKNSVLKTNHIYPANGEIIFTKRNSTIKIIYETLSQANGEFVRVRDLSKRIKKSDSYTRIVLNQLKEKIQKSNKNIKIESNRKGSYRLIVS